MCVESNAEKEVKVILKNIYLTFGVGGTKLKVQGIVGVSFDSISSMYSMEYAALSHSEKVALLSYLPDYYGLNVHEKNDENL